jgi:hypothetical protein
MASWLRALVAGPSVPTKIQGVGPRGPERKSRITLRLPWEDDSGIRLLSAMLVTRVRPDRRTIFPHEQEARAQTVLGVLDSAQPKLFLPRTCLQHRKLESITVTAMACIS